jgi:hypothetical protein
MSQYPSQGQDPNQPQGQYPGQGEHTQYPPGYGSTPAPGAPQYGEQQPSYQQPPYQQGGYQQQPPYQQGVYQQQQQQQQAYSPYQQSPYPQAPAMSFDYRNIIAGVGALVAVIAFFLPFSSFLYTSIYSTYSPSGFQLGGRLWLDFIIALLALGVVVLLQFNEQLLKTAVNPTLQRLRTSLTDQPKTWYTGLIALGSFGIFFHFILDVGQISSWGIGSWLFLLGLIAIVVGGVLYIRPPTPAPALGAQPYQQPQAPGAQPYQAPPTGPQPYQAPPAGSQPYQAPPTGPQPYSDNPTPPIQ